MFNDYNADQVKKALNLDCIVYSPNKYRETEGIKDIGLNDWNQGRTQEIKERYVHLGGDE